VRSTQLGALSALATSFTWAYPSNHFASASREIGAPRVNHLRALVVLPLQLILALATSGWTAFRIPLRQVAWLLGSAICSNAVADSLFFEAARRTGVPTHLGADRDPHGCRALEPRPHFRDRRNCDWSGFAGDDKLKCGNSAHQGFGFRILVPRGGLN
jgi:hypothetical protein